MRHTQQLTVTIIQSDLHWEDKEANLQSFESKIRSIDQSAELIVLPEMFSTGFTMHPEGLAERMDGRTVQWMRRLSSFRNAVITGSMIAEENGRYYNRLIWMLPNGEFGYYDKRHLFGFAGEHNHYSPGEKKLIASLKGWKINLQICYDLRFPVWARQPVEAEKQYDVYLNVASWPDKRRHAWKSLLTARAIENQAITIGVNRVGVDGNNHRYAGDSMVIDPLGEIIWQKEEEEIIHTLTLDKEMILATRKQFPFLNDADGYLLL